jgi:hypothetical protein
VSWAYGWAQGRMELRHYDGTSSALDLSAGSATVGAVQERLRGLLCERERLRRDGASPLEILRNREAIAAAHRALAHALIREHSRPPAV